MADKIQNTPVTTLMHNFKLQGSVYHSAEEKNRNDAQMVVDDLAHEYKWFKEGVRKIDYAEIDLLIN